jgi:DNA mismatch repair protein MutS
VAEAAADLPRREGLRRALGGLLDLERLLGRVALDSAGPRELVALAGALACLPGVRDAVGSFHSRRWCQLAGTLASAGEISTEGSGELSTASAEISTGSHAPFDALEDLYGLIAATIVDEPPVNLAEGGVIRAGVDAELDELRELGRSGRQALAGIEERERQRTGIGSLKVRFNSVFGYYLEVT